MSFLIVHEHNAPNNALRFEIIKYKHIGRIEVDFFHPRWPDKEVDGIEPDTFRTAKLEADVSEAIKLRDALTEAIEDIVSYHDKTSERSEHERS